MPGQRPRGFTLIELLVALFITAIMFAFGYRALDQAFSSRREVDEQSARLIAVQQALRTLEQDVELLQPRPMRNLIGDGYLPARDVRPQSSTPSAASAARTAASSDNSTSSLGSISTLNGATQPLVTFTRGGWTNPAGIAAQRAAACQLFDRERRADAPVLPGAGRHPGGGSRSSAS